MMSKADLSPAELAYHATAIIGACEVLSYVDPEEDETDIREISDEIMGHAKHIKELAERSMSDE